MRERIGQIRQLLNEIEEQAVAAPEGRERDFSALELPLVVQEIVDDLQPLLNPYEAALYWYAFRHSIAKNGNPHVRLSTRRLQEGLVKSFRSADGPLALDTVRAALRALEDAGAIRKEGEPNRDGTLYRVLIPDEIDACRKSRAARQPAESEPGIKTSDIDYYNVRGNRIRVYERDEYKCRYCGKQLTRFTCTLDHVRPIADHGDNSFENLVTACLDCNSRKNGRAVGDFLAERPGTAP